MNKKQIFQQARMSRDVRFDGQFFIAVKSTGIFCRNICPAKLPAEKNVSYYLTAPEAVIAGYRPCLRCRPDSAPGSQNWNRQDNLANQVAKQIENGELQHKTLLNIAEDLGVSSRYLYQVFVKRYGLSPKKFTQITSCLFAQTLLRDSTLSIADIALSSGFNSISQFNHSFKRYFKMTPTQMRKTKKSQEHQISIKLYYRPPYNWNFFLSFQQKRLIESVEWISNNTYGRTINLFGTQGYLEITNVESQNYFKLKISLDDWSKLQLVLSKIKQLLDIDSDIAQIETQIQQQNPQLQIISGIRIPGVLGVFEAGLRAICGQQISVVAAKNLVSQIAYLCNLKMDDSRYLFPTAEDVLKMDFSLLRTTHAKKNTIFKLAQWCVESTNMEDVDSWLNIKGIGRWTVDYVKLRALGNPDIWMGGDLGIKQALAKTANINSEGVRPWRSYLTYQLWNSLYV